MPAVMNHVHHQIRVDAPIERAFALACQADRQHEWNPYMTCFHLSGPLDRPGTAYDVVFDMRGQSTPFRATVAEATPPKLLHIHLSGDKGNADWFYRFEPSDGGTSFTIDVDYEKEGLFAGVVDKLSYHAGLDGAVRHIVESFAAMAAAKTPTPA